MRYLYYVFVFLVALSGCNDKNPDPKFQPTDILLGVKPKYTIDKVFDLINESGVDVEYIEYSWYRSSLPADSLEHVLNYLNSKSYAHHPDWPVIGYLHFQTNIIHVNPTRLFQMNDTKNQVDWLESMKAMKLVEVTDNPFSKMLYLHVPKGREKEWVEKFQQMEIVEWAQLNYYREISR